MDPRDPGELRRTFDSVAERYDRARPGYPAAVFEEIAAFARLGVDSRVLEVGPGTAQATVPLAQRGYRVVAVELGPQLAAVARRRLVGYPKVDVFVASFEEWPLPPEPFDAVIFATAFHWIDPEIRLAKAGDALRRGGTLAIIGTQHVAGATEQFFVDVQECYERWDPTTPPGLRLPLASEVVIDTEELDRSGRFGPVTLRTFEWEAVYSTAQYLDLLLTYSGHLALEPDARQHLLDCIGLLIADRYGGQIVKRYLTDLRLARKTD
ncbi:MAG: class I SAM-dependent methyltransferase [Chloroflexota bacterium]|nr:class I SAM-dependent methyltransferase [Chloroflexota bacterium]